MVDWAWPREGDGKHRTVSASRRPAPGHRRGKGIVQRTKGERIMTTVDHAQAVPESGPQRPHVGFKDLVWQFWADVFGKEVQSATTYSYVWMADQSGHVCLGIVLTFLLATLARWIGITP